MVAIFGKEFITNRIKLPNETIYTFDRRQFCPQNSTRLPIQDGSPEAAPSSSRQPRQCFRLQSCTILARGNLLCPAFQRRGLRSIFDDTFQSAARSREFRRSCNLPNRQKIRKEIRPSGFECDNPFLSKTKEHATAFGSEKYVFMKYKAIGFIIEIISNNYGVQIDRVSTQVFVFYNHGIY